LENVRFNASMARVRATIALKCGTIRKLEVWKGRGRRVYLATDKEGAEKLRKAKFDSWKLREWIPAAQFHEKIGKESVVGEATQQ
jgi:hypothetical protein